MLNFLKAKSSSFSGMQVSVLLYESCALGDAQRHYYIGTGHASSACSGLPLCPDSSSEEPQLLALAPLGPSHQNYLCHIIHAYIDTYILYN